MCKHIMTTVAFFEFFHVKQYSLIDSMLICVFVMLMLFRDADFLLILKSSFFFFWMMMS